MVGVSETRDYKLSFGYGGLGAQVFCVKKVRCVEKCRRIYHAKMFLIIKINAKVLTQLQTNTKSNKDRRWKNKRIVVSIAPKNNPESPPEQTAKAFFLQRTTKHQHTARPNKILLCQCRKDSLRLK